MVEQRSPKPCVRGSNPFTRAMYILNINTKVSTINPNLTEGPIQDFTNLGWTIVQQELNGSMLRTIMTHTEPAFLVGS